MAINTRYEGATLKDIITRHSEIACLLKRGYGLLVFDGYIDKKKSCFAEINGKKTTKAKALMAIDLIITEGNLRVVKKERDSFVVEYFLTTKPNKHEQ